MSSGEKITMTYVCSQKWEKMTKVSCGRYCNKCEKIIYDFTRLSSNEIKQKKMEDPDVCGMFLPHQVKIEGEVEISLTHIKKWLTRIAAVATLTVGGKVKAQVDTIRVEHIQTPENDSLTVSQDVVIPLPSGRTYPEVTPKCAGLLEKPRARVYFSKRFPFLHIRRRIRGKIKITKSNPY